MRWCGRRVSETSRWQASSTLCRFERRAERQWAVAIHQVLVEQFIASHRRAPRELVIDFDATDDPVHGHQHGRFFHGYYDRYCFLPLYAFCGRQLLAAYLRPSNIDAARHTWAILSRLVERLRQAWPGVRIVLRRDSAFCRHRMLDRCERHRVGYVVGLARNAVLEREVEVACEGPDVPSRRPGGSAGCSPKCGTARALGAGPGGSSPVSSTEPRGGTRASS